MEARIVLLPNQNFLGLKLGSSRVLGAQNTQWVDEICSLFKTLEGLGFIFKRIIPVKKGLIWIFDAIIYNA